MTSATSNRSPGQSCLQTRITEIIRRYEAQDEPPGRARSESLVSGFTRYIWPKIRDDYYQMTLSLEEELKTILKERHIDAEVSSRVKEDASITKTLKRRQEGLLADEGSGFNSYQHIFHEMHDLSGLRIVLMDRDDRGKALELIEGLFKQQKLPVHFDPNREVGQFWRRPWFGAYETHNHRLQLANESGASLGDTHQYSGVMFEIQLTTFSDNLYNKLAHDLLYKADPGLVTGQEEMVIDVSHGLARCFELCMRILRPKLHRDTNNRTATTAEDFRENTEKEVKLAQSAVKDFERDLHNQSESNRAAQLLKKLLSKEEDAADQACLKDLLVSDPRDDKTRIEETNGGLLSRSYIWILEDHDFQRWLENGQNTPFWITGDPGKGKTMMLCGIINELSKESGENVSYFLCQGTDKRINTGTAVLRGLLFLLCNQQHSLISHIRVKYDNAGGKLFDDANAWFALSSIFENILRDSGLRSTYLIVDALDECVPESRQLLVRLIVQMSKTYPTVKWIVSSRDLEEFKTNIREASQLSLESRGESVSEAVNAYINSKVAKLGEHLGPAAMERLAYGLRKRSEGTFLWVSIVCKELESAQEYEVMEVLQEMPTGLNELYGKLVQDIKALKRKTPTYCQSVLRAIAVAFRPLTLKELQELADLPQNVPAETIAKMCRSLLTTREDTVFYVHQSANDFMWNEWNTIFQSGIEVTHESMFSRSVEAMERILKQDIYNLRYAGTTVKDIQRPSPDPLVSIRYSCVYWIAHFREAEPCPTEDQFHGFLRNHFLHWFEALSLIGSTPAGVDALRDLIPLCLEGSRFEPLLDFIRDMHRFAKSHRAIIEEAPLQIYSSALIFSPACSLTREIFTSKEPDWILQKPRVEENWDSCLATLTGNTVSETEKAGTKFEIGKDVFSPDAQRLASGSADGIIQLWDIDSSAETLQLKDRRSHRHSVSSVALTLDGRRIASGSHDNTIKIWDAETGDHIRTLEYEFVTGIRSVVFSPDCRCIAASTLRNTFVVSDADSGATISTGSHPFVGPIALSLDSRYIASWWERTLMIAESSKHLVVLRGHSGIVTSLTFSPQDRNIVASASADKTIKIWNVVIGAAIFSLDIDGVLRLLRFDSTGALFYADSVFAPQDSAWSLRSTSTQTELALPQVRQNGYGVNKDCTWITWNGQNVLWLPPEFREGKGYRRRVCDVLPHMITIGCPSGRVWWIKFSSENYPFVP